MALHSDFVSNYIANIDQWIKPSEYGLERGERFEKMVAEVLGLYGISAAPYGQHFPDNCSMSNREGFVGSRSCIKGHQKDLWTQGGLTGKRYPVEVKERRHHQGSSIFDYPDILVGKAENWDLKNALAVERAGYKGILAMIIVCGHTGEIRVTSTSLESQLLWNPVCYGHEICYAVPTRRFATLETFINHVKTL